MHFVSRQEDAKPQIIEPQRQKTYLQTYAPNEESDQTARMRSLISLRCPLEQIVHLGYPKYESEESKNNFRWAHMSADTFHDVAGGSFPFSLFSDLYVPIYWHFSLHYYYAQTWSLKE